MSDLISRLKAAEGPSRELDCYLYCANHAGVSMLDVECGRVDPPAYTADINAALTLVPEGYTASIFIREDGLENACHLESSCELWPGHAATPALAICIAALKARGGV